MDIEEDLIRKQLLNLDFEEFITKTKTNRIGKSFKYSAKARQKGNQLYVEKNHSAEAHKEIFNFYCTSIAYAPEASEELALAFGNRSALLFHFKKYKESLEDLNRALNITISNSLKVKMFCRKVDCLTKLDLPGNQIAFKEAIKYFNKIESSEEKRNLSIKINKTKFILEHNNAKVIFNKDNKKVELRKGLLEKEKDAFNSVEIKYSEKYGRYLISKQEFKPGQIIYIEKPYAVCSNVKTPYIYCCHCLVITWAGIPCKHCNWCIFCSVECREKAWKTYHNIECFVFPYLKRLNKNFINSFRLSIRIMIMGIKEFGRIDKLKIEIERMDKSTDNPIESFLKNGKLVNDSFQSVYNLSHNLSKEQLKTNIYNTAITLVCIIKYTSFFKSNFLKNQKLDNLAQNKEVLFIGALLLRLINISYANRHRILNSLLSCNNSSQPFKCIINECCSKGVCLAPITSLINNSCNSNVKKCFTEDHKIIIYAVESIDKNSQIFDSYLCNFYDMPNTYRNPILKQQFHLTCNCVACERNWPALLNTTQVERKFVNVSRNFFENKLIEEHKKMLISIHDKNTKYDEKTVQYLVKVIEKASKLLDQPCSIRCILNFSLQKVFEKLYGDTFQIFDNC